MQARSSSHVSQKNVDSGPGNTMNRNYDFLPLKRVYKLPGPNLKLIGAVGVSYTETHSHDRSNGNDNDSGNGGPCLQGWVVFVRSCPIAPRACTRRSALRPSAILAGPVLTGPAPR